ncbi:hypothetical protein DFJ77DRAFT_308239 [Powellomyces hirtus]|nr:hypothetical protein DFJ77DRAFT_308239 [Powellomyces hirtus]
MSPVGMAAPEGIHYLMIDWMLHEVIQSYMNPSEPGSAKKAARFIAMVEDMLETLDDLDQVEFEARLLLYRVVRVMLDVPQRQTNACALIDIVPEFMKLSGLILRGMGADVLTSRWYTLVAEVQIQAAIEACVWGGQSEEDAGQLIGRHNIKDEPLLEGGMQSFLYQKYREQLRAASKRPLLDLRAERPLGEFQATLFDFFEGILEQFADPVLDSKSSRPLLLLLLKKKKKNKKEEGEGVHRVRRK